MKVRSERRGEKRGTERRKRQSERGGDISNPLVHSPDACSSVTGGMDKAEARDLTGSPTWVRGTWAITHCFPRCTLVAELELESRYFDMKCCLPERCLPTPLLLLSKSLCSLEYFVYTILLRQEQITYSTCTVLFNNYAENKSVTGNYVTWLDSILPLENDSIASSENWNTLAWYTKLLYLMILVLKSL